VTVRLSRFILYCCSFAEHPDFKQMSLYAIACVHHTDYDEARRSFMDLLKMSPSHAPTLYNLACVESLAGNADAAFTHVRTALECGYRNFKNLQRGWVCVCVCVCVCVMCASTDRCVRQTLISRRRDACRASTCSLTSSCRRPRVRK
jgi:hypothetical protein